MNRGILCIISLVILWSSWINTAQAASLSCDEDLTCLQLQSEGMEHFSSKRYSAALDSYRRAYAVRPDPILLYNLGRSAQGAGLYPEAADYYRRYLSFGDAVVQEQRIKTEQHLAEVEAMLRRRSSSTDAIPPPEVSPPQASVTETPRLLEISPKPEATPTPYPPSSSETQSAIAGSRRSPPALYKQWWLWTSIGVLVSGIAVGVGLGLYSRPPDLSGATELTPFGP